MNGFPNQSATTGLSPAIPNKTQVRFRTRRCSGDATQSVPDFWVETIDTADVAVDIVPEETIGKETYIVKDDALALFNVGGMTPTNQTALHDLAIQIATDKISWQSVSFNVVFNGIIAPDPNGLLDRIEWNASNDSPDTRILTQPLNGEPEEFQHNDPANAQCIEVIGQLYVSKTPCIEPYIPKWRGPSGAPAPLEAYRSLVCLTDGRLIETFSNEDFLTCFCGSGPCITTVRIDVHTCNPSSENGILIVIKDQHGTTVLSGTTSGTPPTGTIVFPNFDCDNTATYTITISKTGFTTITQPLPIVCCIFNAFMFDLNANPLPRITVNFHVASCYVGALDDACSDCTLPNSAPGIENVVVGVTVNGVFISCTTNSNGDCSINFPVRTNGAHYPISASGGNCVSAYVYNPGQDIVDTCLNQTVGRCIVVPPDPACQCFCCQNPRPKALFLTDSVYGVVNLNWGMTADGAFRYSGQKTVSFTGACGCPADTVTIEYFLDCLCHTVTPGANDTYYSLFFCYTQYDFFEFCAGGSFLKHTCPGSPNPVNPGTLCQAGRGLQIPYCPAPVAGEKGNNLLVNSPFLTSVIQNTTEKCSTPLHIVFNGNPSVNCAAGGFGGGPCQWHGIACPTPWPIGATFTVNE